MGNQADEHVPLATGPGGNSQCRDGLTFGRVDDDLGLATDQHTPPLGERLIETVDLKGDRSRTRGRGCPEDDITTEGAKIDWKGLGSASSEEDDPPHAARPNQVTAGSWVQVREGGIPGRLAMAGWGLSATPTDTFNRGLERAGQPSQGRTRQLWRRARFQLADVDGVHAGTVGQGLRTQPQFPTTLGHPTPKVSNSAHVVLLLSKATVLHNDRLRQGRSSQVPSPGAGTDHGCCPTGDAAVSLTKTLQTRQAHDVRALFPIVVVDLSQRQVTEPKWSVVSVNR
jgi:hypothetical protein